MSTFIQLQNKINNFFGANDDEFYQETQSAINDTISEINTDQPEAPHLQASDTFTLTTGVSLVTDGIPDDYDHMCSIRLVVNGKDSDPLTFLSKKEWDEERIYEKGSDQPTHYTIWEGELYVAPLPDKAYTGKIEYYSFDNELTLDSDTCKLTDKYVRWEHLIEKGAKAKLHEYLQSDETGILLAQQKFDKAMLRFRAWIRRNYDKSPQSSRIKNWKELRRSKNLLVPEVFRS